MKPSTAIPFLPRRARVAILKFVRPTQLAVWIAEAEVLRAIAVARHDHEGIQTADAFIAELKAAQLRRVRV